MYRSAGIMKRRCWLRAAAPGVACVSAAGRST